MLVRAAAITGGLLFATGIAAAQMLASQPTSLKLSDLVDPAAQHDPAAPSNRSIVRRHPAEAVAAGVPTCPWDCEPVPDKQIGINDFLAVLAQWGMIGGSCDFDGGGVGINDFLAILANWGPCPAPVNDECAGKIIIDRLDAGGMIQEQFDMWGATPSPDPSQCTGVEPNTFKDIWYCLRNSAAEPKSVTLSGSVDLLAEVTSGCDCANPGPMVVCERLVAAVPTPFMMQPADEVCIRLLNDLGLANDALNGNLVITNELVPPVNDECDGKIIIDRLNSAGKLTEPFDMTGATPSADATLCAAVAVQDIWYCLRNSTGDEIDVTLGGTVDVLAEVTTGCDCANPGKLMACGSLLVDPVPTFTMQPGDEVCIRLHNEPGGAVTGDLVITNEPAGPPSVKCFDQQPNHANGLFSDLDCDTCASPQQVLAEQLVLVTAEQIDELRFWGGYFPGDAGGGEPLPDAFTVKFRLNDDSSGVDLPGTVVRKLEFGPATTRTETGLTLFGVREFEYTISLQTNQDLDPGTYWVEIYNDTTNDPTNDDWFWETGTLDAANGLPGSAFSFDPPNVPPEDWTFDQDTDLSLSITCKGEPPPLVHK